MHMYPEISSLYSFSLTFLCFLHSIPKSAGAGWVSIRFLINLHLTVCMFFDPQYQYAIKPTYLAKQTTVKASK